jgi:hypothetical protein
MTYTAQGVGRQIDMKIRFEELKERDHLDDLGIDRRIVLKWVFKK